MYGTFTRFLHKPSLSALPLLLSVWPMAYAVIVVATSVVPVMGWQHPLLRWRWILHALFLVAVTTSWIMLVLWPWNRRGDSLWLGGSLIVLPALVITSSLVRDPERKLHWMNLIAMVWISMAFFARPQGKSPFAGTLNGVLAIVADGSILVLGSLLILVGSASMLLAKEQSGSVAVNLLER
jgi:hypothetical protein